MARRRLTPFPSDTGTRPPAPAAAPIARVAGEAASEAALREVSAELTRARADGRLMQRIALAEVEPGWLLRDRIAPEDDEFDALVQSLRAHGQRTPIEVVELGPERFGLISGWRRLTALKRLHAETGEARFAVALAVLRRPDSAAEAYLAMVEENEIRAGLSYYERARIVARAAEAGVFPGERAALQGLFAAASRPRRSKIGAFLPIYRALDGVLRFPAALPERAGLALSRALVADPGLARRLRGALAAAPPQDAAAEQAIIARVLQGREGAARQAGAPDAGAAETERASSGGARSDRAGTGAPDVAPEAPRRGRTDPVPASAHELRPGLFLEVRPGRLTLHGPAVDTDFQAMLERWASGVAD